MLYEDGGAVEVKDTRLSDYLKNETGEKLLLAFPDTADSMKMNARLFLILFGDDMKYEEVWN